MGVDMDGGSELVVAAEHDDAAPGHSKGEEYLAGSAPPYLEVLLETLETLEILRLLRLVREGFKKKKTANYPHFVDKGGVSSLLDIHIFVVTEAIGILYHGTIPDSGQRVSRVQDGREQGWPAP